MKNYRVSKFLFVAAITLCAAPAYADDSAVVRVGTDITTLLIQGLGVLIAALLVYLLNLLSSKLKIQIPIVWQDKLNTYLDKGINFAEEQARKQIKKIDGVVSDKIPDKLETAALFILDTVNDKKIVEMGKERIKKEIEARLQVTRDWKVLASDASRSEATVKTE